MKAYKNDVQDTNIDDSRKKNSIKMIFYFNIFNRSILDFFWELHINIFWKF